MDSRRLDTGQVLAAGILNRPIPKAPWPEGREDVSVHLDYPGGEEWIGNGQLDAAVVREAVERLAVVGCPEYYGFPKVWKADDGAYRGVLLQYRSISEDHTFATVDEAVEWFCATAAAVAG